MPWPRRGPHLTSIGTMECKVENNTTPVEAMLHPDAYSELARWRFLLLALGHDYEARGVCEYHIAELLVDYDGVEHADDLDGISQQRAHELGDLNCLADATVGVIQKQATLVSRSVAERDELSSRLEGLERTLRATLETLESYADDHNSDRPTDPTVMIPLLRKWVGTHEQTDLFVGPHPSRES